MIRKIIPRDILNAFIVGVIILLVLLFYGGRIIYNKSMVKLTKHKQERARIQLENEVGSKLEKFKEIRAEVKSVKESSRFLAEVAKIAGQLNMKIRSISVLPVQKHAEFVKLGVNLEVGTNYHELGFFLSRLEGADIFIAVDNLDITSSLNKEESLAGEVNVKMYVSTFSFTDTILEQ